jgi:hypothetical protein
VELCVARKAKSFENIYNLNYLRIAIINRKEIDDDIKGGINSENNCYCSLQ